MAITEQKSSILASKLYIYVVLHRTKYFFSNFHHTYLTLICAVLTTPLLSHLWQQIMHVNKRSIQRGLSASPACDTGRGQHCTIYDNHPINKVLQAEVT